VLGLTHKMHRQAGRATVGAMIAATTALCLGQLVLGWRVENAIVSTLAVAAEPQSARVSATEAITCTRLMGNEPLRLELMPGSSWELIALRMHLAEDGAKEDLAASTLSQVDPAYNCVQWSVDTHNASDFMWTPTRPVIMCDKSAMLIEWANTDEIVYGLEIYWRSL
jgi:hypothetical protein